MRWAGVGEIRNVYTFLSQKQERKGSLGRCRQKWEDSTGSG
jgi:hypothetical protein